MSVGLQVSPEWWVAGPYQWRLSLVRTSGGCRWSVPVEADAALPQVMKTCRMMGIQTVAVHSDVDASAVSPTSNHQSTQIRGDFSVTVQRLITGTASKG